MVLHFYRLIARFYGINYEGDKNYILKSMDVNNDINKLFYVNHEDEFTANQITNNSGITNKLFYHEMEKETHSSLRIGFFRTFFENIPQLVLQYKMIDTL